jgi:hypothetical protein
MKDIVPPTLNYKGQRLNRSGKGSSPGSLRFVNPAQEKVVNLFRARIFSTGNRFSLARALANEDLSSIYLGKDSRRNSNGAPDVGTEILAGPIADLRAGPRADCFWPLEKPSEGDADQESGEAGAQLEVSKAVEQLVFILRSYDVPFPASRKADYKHDLRIMRERSDLSSIRIEFLAEDGTVLSEFKIEFDGKDSRRNLRDPGKGIELPLIPRHLIDGHRLVISRNSREVEYSNLLKRSWGRAGSRTKRPGASYVSDHAAYITGGRQHGAFFVSDESRHSLIVTRTGEQEFAFGLDTDLDAENVFLHPAYAPPGFSFEAGSKLSAVVIQTPRGLAARAIRPAT